MELASRPSSARLLPRGLRVLRLTAGPRELALLVEPGAGSARCPLCGSCSERVHSRYVRTVSDLPWRGICVTLKIRARRFFCDAPHCGRAIFCERLPDVAAHARKTGRLEEGLLAIALELGGEAGARLARELGLLASPDTMLRRVRRVPSAPTGAVRVLGVRVFGEVWTRHGGAKAGAGSGGALRCGPWGQAVREGGEGACARASGGI